MLRALHFMPLLNWLESSKPVSVNPELSLKPKSCSVSASKSKLLRRTSKGLRNWVLAPANAIVQCLGYAEQALATGHLLQD